MVLIDWFLVVERVPGKRVSAMCLRQVKQDFSSLFLTYLRIFQSRAHQRCCRTLKNYQIWQKIEETPCLTCLNLIFRLILRTRKLDFGYVLVPPLIGTTFEYEYTVHYFTTDWKKICPNALWTFLVPKAAIYVID